MAVTKEEFMKHLPMISRQLVRATLLASGAVAVVALGNNAWAANDLDTVKAGLDTNAAAVHNTKWLGHNDAQGRVIYQTTVHKYPDGRFIAFAGHFSTNPPYPVNTLTGVAENNGTSLIAVTDPRNP